MPCNMPPIAMPPIAVEAVVTVRPGVLPTFHAHGASAAFVKRNGDLNFSCFHHPIVVSFTIATPHVSFQGDGNKSLSFADDPAKGRPMVLPPRQHQFPIGVQHLGPRRIWFVYNNDRDCGVGDNKPRCLISAYGLNLVSTGHHVRHLDPIIGNGGHGSY